MQKKTQLIIIYYIFYFLLIIELALAHFYPYGIELSKQTAMYINTVNILILMSIPLVLWFCAGRIKKDSSFDNYYKWAIIQMCLIAVPAITSGITYYLLHETSGLFSCFIALVALIFCKPNKYVETTNQD